MQKAVEFLWSGNPRERLDVTANAGEVFWPLEDQHQESEPRGREIVESLRMWMRAEKDDWVPDRLLQGLEELDADALRPLFLSALESRSPNLRSRAIHWFAGRDDPEALDGLETAWREEKRPWVRADLVRALARRVPEKHEAEFMALINGEDERIASAAIEAIHGSEDPRMVSVLASASRRGRPGRRSLAVSALASWPDSHEALDAVLAASHAEDADVREAAAAALGHFADDAAGRRLIELAGSPELGDMRWKAVRALGEGMRSEALETLLSILAESATDENPLPFI